MGKIMLAVAVLLLVAGCGGAGSSSTSAPPPLNIQGSWQIVTKSTVNPAPQSPFTFIETNLSQTGTNVFAGPQGVIVMQFAFTSSEFSNFNACQASAVEPSANEAISAVIRGTSLSFSLVESGSRGTNTITGTATISADGKAMTGTYTVPTGCGQSADAGTLEGTLQTPLSGTYAYNLGVGNNPPATFTQGANFALSISVPGFKTLTGSVIGGTFSVQAPGNPFVFIGFPVHVDATGRDSITTDLATLNGFNMWDAWAFPGDAAILKRQSN